MHVKVTRRIFVQAALATQLVFGLLGSVPAKERSSKNEAEQGDTSTLAKKPHIVADGFITRDPSESAFMPYITPLSDGTWIATQYTASSLAAPDTEVQVLLSRDEGRHWERLPGLNLESSDNPWSYRSPSTTELPDGRLAMLVNRFRFSGKTLADLKTGAMPESERLVLWSSDAGHSWSAPQVVPADLPADKYTCHGMGRLMVLKPNRWMYPLQVGMPKGYANRDHKAAAVFTEDAGKTWSDFTIVADDTDDRIEYHDQNSTLLSNGDLYTMFWAIDWTKQSDLTNHWAISRDCGRSWSSPQPTNLRGQVCCPIALSDGRIAVIYNYRHKPQGVRLAVSNNFSEYDLENEVVVFDAGSETSTQKAANNTVIAKNTVIAFGRPNGVLLPNGDVLVAYFCTTGGVTHGRWAQVSVP
ncbi:sialidase family protein [Adhaeretor mobilis]|uniref:Sialidase domain-containing protein n=1 Tax=Adhaeretor mobilis TaxID=1930276 RepID=A0A517MZU2_9BACT|nr:sialidase family protein [Adhaeretor mobilis]QDT00401.1 hypothetical protein HG15A2_37370 [Adhaeretor mobilis]